MTSCSEFLSTALTRLCWLRCTFQTEWPSSFRTWTRPTEESDFSSTRGRCALCFPTLIVTELIMCKLFKIYLSRQNVRCLKFNIGLWKWMSEFSLRSRGGHSFEILQILDYIFQPSGQLGVSNEVPYIYKIMCLNSFVLLANYVILLSSNLNHVSCLIISVECISIFFNGRYSMTLF